MHINNNKLPPTLLKLIEDGSWQKLPAKKDYLETIYKGSYNSLEDLELYNLRVMKIETENLTERCDPTYEHSEKFRVFFQGEPDKEYPPGDIHFPKSILIGDLGLGSDAPIALDFRRNENEPSVIILHRFFSGDDVKTRWLKIADTFDDFWDAIRPAFQ